MSLLRFLKSFRKPDAVRPDGVDAQVYAEASIENAIHSADKANDQIESVKARSTATNERLAEGIKSVRKTVMSRTAILDSLVRDAKEIHRL